jgi:diguanylate cyclase (GGDEF)-like protein
MIVVPQGDTFSLVRRLDAPVWLFDIDNAEIVCANSAACKLWKAVDEDDLRARNLGADMSDTVKNRLKQHQSDFISDAARFHEMWTFYPNGEPSNVMVILSGFTLEDGRMAMLCEAIGVTDEQPENIRSAEALLYTDVMIALFSTLGPALYMNPAARNTLGSGQRDLSALFINSADYYAMVSRLDSAGEDRQVVEVMTPAGRRWYDVTAKTCTDAVTGQAAVLVTAIDVSELKNARDRARFLADRDQLTGCFNRSALQSIYIERQKKMRPENCAVIYCDIDRFKQINDQYGHEVGDTVLKQFAARARHNLRTNDVIARLGGDEFVIMLTNINSDDEIAQRAQQLRAAIALPIMHDSTRISVEVSMGISIFDLQDLSFSKAMRQSDVALYTSKQRGRDRITFYTDEMGEAATMRDMIENDLKIALKEDSFELHYQPRVDVQTGTVVSAEGLVRWNHPRLGTVMPDQFIPICEETGMIEELGRLVLKIGCAQAIAWHEAGLDIEVSLNLSPRQFADDSLLPLLSDLSSTPGFPHGRIELEITESMLTGDQDLIAEKLQLIDKMGFRIALDDFGTGYSNLSHISRFPLKCIKIDRSFIARLPDSGPIVSLILTLAREVEATVVAEGVETAEHLAWLTKNGCEQIQGYYMSKPMPLKKFPSAVAKIHKNHRK